MNTPSLRIRKLNAQPIEPSGQFVLYWMVANRRLRFNFSLQRAVELSVELEKPLVILEALRCDYQWANDRIHRFVMQGMAHNRSAAAKLPLTYLAYVEEQRGAGSGLLETLANDACAVVTDDFPCFFIPKMLTGIAPRLDLQLEAVDSNGMLPMRAADRVFPTAYAFRRFLQRELPAHLKQMPRANPLSRVSLPSYEIPQSLLKRWPQASDALLSASIDHLARLPIDHSVGPAAFDGGTGSAENTLRTFFRSRFDSYGTERNCPDEEVTSGLSPFLHFGHISVAEVFQKIINREAWSIEKLNGKKSSGKREGWWSMSSEAEGFLDELITWRELGYNMCWQVSNYDQYESLPDWAQTTLEEHESDARNPSYTGEQLESAQTHDPIWNAAQTQLVTEGRMHNYMRMLWGKKILEWSESPRKALSIMIHLNNKYAVDGRNPNSYSGIFWCLGRYDRAWGPERPVFGKIRYMSSDNTARKFSIKNYLARYGSQSDNQMNLF